MAKGRSPNYPSVTLGEAIERIRLVYKAEHTHRADKNVVARDLGYTGLNGKSITLIGALKRYGLLDTEGDGLRVTDDAVTILELPDNDPTRIEAVEKAAFTPTLFEELRDTFGESLPSDDNLRHYLIKKNFLPKAANDVVRIYRDNLQLVSVSKSLYNRDMKPEPSPALTNIPLSRTHAPPVSSEEVFRKFNQQPDPAPQLSGEDVLSFNLSRTGKAQVRFNGQVTQEAIKKLIALLDLSLDTYPTEAEIAKPKRAIWRNKDRDEPVDVTGELGQKEGKMFHAIAGSNTGVPSDELEFEEDQ
jgi:hypothetical protein